MAGSPWLRYTEDLALADKAYQAQRPQEALSRLADCPEEHRGWEWSFLQRLCNGTIRVDVTPIAGSDIAWRNGPVTPGPVSLVSPNCTWLGILFGRASRDGYYHLSSLDKYYHLPDTNAVFTLPKAAEKVFLDMPLLTDQGRILRQQGFSNTKAKDIYDLGRNCYLSHKNQGKLKFLSASTVATDDGEALPVMEDEQLKLLTLPSGKLSAPFPLPSHDAVGPVAFTPDGRLAILCIAGNRASLYLWSIENGSPAPIRPKGMEVHLPPPRKRSNANYRPEVEVRVAFHFCTKGQTFALGTAPAAVYELDNPEPLGTFENCFGLSPDGSRALVMDDKNNIELWDVSLRHKLPPPKCIEWPKGSDLTINADWTRAIVGGSIWEVVPWAPGKKAVAGSMTTRPPPLTNRKAAVWVLGVRGTVDVDVAGRKRHVPDTSQLPERPFRVVAVDLQDIEAVNDDALANLRGLGDCRSVVLSGTNVSDRGLKNLEDFVSLTNLELYSTTVTGDGFKHLTQLHSLERVDALGSRFTDQGVENLLAFPKLTEVDLTDTKVSANGVAKLQAALPHCKIAVSSDRKAADWVLSVGGRINVLVAAKERHIPDPSQLPEEPFRVVAIDLNNIRAADDHSLVNLRGLTDCRSVVLSRTQVSDRGLKNLADFVSLRNLEIHFTGVTGYSFKYLTRLQSLERLSAFGSRFTDQGVEKLRALPKLAAVDLSYTQLSDAGMARLAEMKQLARILIAGPKITNLGLERIWEMPELEGLWFAEMRSVDGRGIVGLAKLPKLTKLWMGDVSIADDQLRELTALKRLVHFGLEGSKITDAGLDSVKLFRELTILGLSRTSITDGGLRSLVDLSRLEDLRLSNTGISDRGLESLEKMRTLKILNLTDTKVSVNGIAKLQAALPHCKIIENSKLRAELDRIQSGKVEEKYAYRGGQFTRYSHEGKPKWVESKTDNSSRFVFIETTRNEEWIHLFDASRNGSLRLPVGGGTCTWSTDGGKNWINLYRVVRAE